MADPPVRAEEFATWTAARWSELAPQEDSAAAEVAIRFIRVAHELSESHARAIRPWKEHGVNTIDDFRTLGLLRHVGEAGLRIQHIAEHLNAEPSTVSSRVARLEKYGLVERIEDSVDRRGHPVRLTADKETVIDEIYEALVANHQRFFSKLTSDEHSTLARYLGKI